MEVHRERLTKFQEQQRLKATGKMDEILEKTQESFSVICSSLDPQQLSTVPIENREETCRNTISRMKEIVEYSLKEAKITKMNMETLECDVSTIELTETVETYENMIAECYSRVTDVYRTTCENFVRKWENVMKRYLHNDEEVSKTTNILINLNFITVCRMKDISRILQKIEFELGELSTCNNECEKSQIENNLKSLLKRWFAEENLIGEKQMDLLNSLKHSRIQNQIMEMFNRFNSLHHENHNSRYIQIRVYSLLQNEPLDEDALSLVSGYRKEFLDFKTTMDDCYKNLAEKYPTDDIIPIFN